MIFDKMGVVKWDCSFEVNFKAFFKKWLTFAIIQLLGNELSLIERLQS